MSRCHPSLRRASAVLLCIASGLAACGHAPPSAAPPPAAEEGGAEPRAAGTGEVVTADDVKGVKARRAEELLAGRFAGVEVTPLAGGGVSVRIRGATSVMGSNEPLYVIDGMPVRAGPGGALHGINPYDIARIEVLKDAGSTAQWGVRGANGVVLITTMRGR